MTNHPHAARIHRRIDALLIGITILILVLIVCTSARAESGAALREWARLIATSRRIPGGQRERRLSFRDITSPYRQPFALGPPKIAAAESARPMPSRRSMWTGGGGCKRGLVWTRGQTGEQPKPLGDGHRISSTIQPTASNRAPRLPARPRLAPSLSQAASTEPTTFGSATLTIGSATVAGITNPARQI